MSMPSALGGHNRVLRLGMKQCVNRYDRPQATGRGQAIAQEERQVLRRRVMDQAELSTGYPRIDGAEMRRGHRVFTGSTASP